jgi:flavodoxin
MMKILVVYYSRTGFTRTLAQHLAKSCNADIEAIEDESICGGRANPVGYVRSALEAILHFKPGIRPGTHAPADYDLTLIGTPVWFWNASSPVRAYLEQHRNEIRQLAFFCTFAGSGQVKVLKDLHLLGGKHVLANLAISDAEITGKQYKTKVKNFVAHINRSLSPQEGSRTDTVR